VSCAAISQSFRLYVCSTRLRNPLFPRELLLRAVPQLNTLFGDHTFFLDGDGLNVLEPAETPELERQTGEVVSIASWSDATLTSLRPHEPEPTGVVIDLESKH